MSTFENSDYIKPKNTGTKNMFDNPVLEKLTRVHAVVPITMYYVMPIFLLAYGAFYTSLSSAKLALLFFGGAFFFTFLEYVLHRYVFHMNTDTEARKKIQYNIHGLHHDYPKDKDRLAMPLPASITLAIVLYTVFYLLMGINAYGFLAGVMVGYSTYLCVHYVVHAYPPPKNFLKALWINHSVHHYKGGDHAFGVSSPLWDYVFGTMPKKKQS
jgi:sterol desaturase/sphingolipid hydroxylase (fatty acid hydroxylase superfamily)